MIRYIFLLIFLLIGCSSPPPQKTLLKMDEVQRLVELHNNVRTESLSLNEKLTEAAQAHADWMADNKTMSHTGRDRSEPWDRARSAGYAYSKIAENIAEGYTDSDDTMNGWMHSTGHKRNILGPY